MITIYTTETCPKCKILKKKLQNKEIPYVEIQDIDELMKLNIDEVPVAKVDDNIMNFNEAITWVNNQ